MFCGCSADDDGDIHSQHRNITFFRLQQNPVKITEEDRIQDGYVKEDHLVKCTWGNRLLIDH